ncbi:MAG TPA: hypothetical protein VN112_16215 [Ensifer sp.]|nr:hypothetical protein [Ensifer sp.]
MAIWKDANGGLHDDMDGAALSLPAWPQGMTLLSDEEAATELQPPAPTETDYSNAIQSMLDAKAREHQYDGIASGVSYRDDPDPKFAAEGQALFVWRSAVWVYSATQLSLVQNGSRVQPTIADFITEIRQQCPFSWPV